MKYAAILLLYALHLVACAGQTVKNVHSESVEKQAKLMADALLSRDYTSFAKYTYFRVIEMAGGEQKMIEAMEEGSKDMESRGVAITAVSFGKVSELIVEKDELQCTIQQEIEMRVPDGRLTTHSTLIAISTDNGESWFFIDTPGRDIQAMRDTYPNLSADLIIPKQGRPVLNRD
jgi:hypothetical protein